MLFNVSYLKTEQLNIEMNEIMNLRIDRLVNIMMDLWLDERFDGLKKGDTDGW